jgi:predicted amidohydrolase
LVQLGDGPPALPSGDLRVAAVQLNAGADKNANVEKAAGLVARAADEGAGLVVLPEKFNGFGSPEVLRDCAEDARDGETVAAMSRWARERSIVLVGGSITERVEGSDKWFNTTIVFDRAGEPVATYRKAHLFDVDVDGLVYRESDLEAAGDELTVVELDGGWRLGLAICYDLRFPELFRALAHHGAHAVALPAAFTQATGRDHWEVLLRARAVENQCYVIAADDYGEHPGGKPTFGRSMVIDPWGLVMANAIDGEGVVAATLEASRLDQVRRSVPALTHRRSDIGAWEDAVCAPPALAATAEG